MITARLQKLVLLQATGEIIFSFRGTENNNLVEMIKDVISDAQIAVNGLTATGPNQFYDAYDFVKEKLRNILFVVGGSSIVEA